MNATQPIKSVTWDDFDVHDDCYQPSQRDALAGIQTTDNTLKEQVKTTQTALLCDSFVQRRGEEIQNDAKEIMGRKLDASNHEVSDFYSAAFDRQPQLSPKCTSPERRAYMENLLNDPAMASIRTSTVSNDAAAEVAALSLTESWVKYRCEQNIGSGRNRAKGPPPSSKGTGKPGEDLTSRVEMMRSIASAGRNCQKAVQDYQEASDALGGDAGGAGGPSHNKIDPKTAAKMFKRVRNSKTLKRIAEKAGRFRRMAAAKQKMKVSHGYDDTIGITTGADVSQILSQELMRLDDPDLGMEASLRFIERQMMQRQLRGVEPAGKGPIVVIVDESGSMMGDKIENAKALALAMAWIARKQRRWCALLNFSDGNACTGVLLPPGGWERAPGFEVTHDEHGKTVCQTIKSENGQAGLMDWLEHMFNGGTTLHVPFIMVPTLLWSKFMASGAKPGKTDMILVTDGQVGLDIDTENKFRAFKVRERVSLYTMLIDAGSQEGDLEKVSDQYFKISSADLRADGEEVGNVLSI